MRGKARSTTRKWRLAVWNVDRRRQTALSFFISYYIPYFTVW